LARFQNWVPKELTLRWQSATASYTSDEPGRHKFIELTADGRHMRAHLSSDQLSICEAIAIFPGEHAQPPVQELRPVSDPAKPQ